MFRRGSLRDPKALTSSIVLLGAACLTGCSHPLGAEFKKTMTLDRIRLAAVHSITSPEVYVPLAGVAVFSIADFDDKVSDWARDHTPVYGSERTARDASDILRWTAAGAAGGTWVLRQPNVESPDTSEWTERQREEWAKWQRDGILGFSAVAVTQGVTEGLKISVGRERPNGEDDKSFPSGHSSGAAATAQVARHNLRRNEHISEGWKRAGDVGLIALPYATAWGRVEAGKHFPSDVLFGMFLGNLFTTFANKLIDLEDAHVYAYPTEDGKSVMLGISISF